MIKDRKYKKDYMKWKGNDIRKRNNLADAERLERECQRKREDQEKLDLERKVKEEQELVKGKGKATPAIESSSDSSSKLSSIDEDPKPTEKDQQ
jgi:Skp family chaperone for outer membrane proteins